VNPFVVVPTLFAAALLVLPQDPDSAQNGERLLRTLQASKLNFEKTPSGRSYQLTYEHAKGRKQIVFVATAANRPLDLVVHTVYTTVWVGAAPPDAALMQKVFGKVKKLGSFYLFESERSWSIRFGASFDATGLAAGTLAQEQATARLQATIEFVNAVGEEVDAELNGERDVR
jgi:hypothetical protein